MELHSTRTLDSLREVLHNPKSTGPKDAYWVFDKVTEGLWENMTVITPGRYGIEYPKTYGHYHTASHEKEIYKLVAGKGLFLLQKKHVDDMGNLVQDIVEEVIVVTAETAGEEVKIPDGYAHSWTNIGETPLITFDNWDWGHKPTDYEPIKEMKGMAFYIVENNGKVELIPNNTYKNHPEPKWVSIKEFNQRFETEIVSLV